jgi:natural product biosynthesis luciferase-like monooxygenase protein
VKFSLFYLTSYIEEVHKSVRGLYDQLLEQVDEAERMGMESVWLAEHHFFDYGGHVPSIPVLAATIAARTKKLKIASGIAMIGLQDPIRVAEQFGMLDQLSNGRVIFGIGRGFQKCEFDAFQRNMDDSRIAFEEAHDVIRKAWSEDRFSFDGRFTKVKNLRVIPKPLQRPMPPFYVACTFTPASFEWTGKHGHNLMVVPYASPDLDVVKQNIELYRSSYAAAGFGAKGGDVICASHFYCGETPEDGKETPRGAIMRYLGQFSESTRDAQHSDAYQGYDGLSEALQKFDYDGFLYPSPRVVFGDPDQCVERLRALEAMGVKHVGFVVDFGGLPHAKIMASLERFRRDVMPRFR